MKIHFEELHEEGGAKKPTKGGNCGEIEPVYSNKAKGGESANVAKGVEPGATIFWKLS